jgi:hypothetical protein
MTIAGYLTNKASEQYEECSGFLEEAENVLLENELGFPPETLVVQNP